MVPGGSAGCHRPNGKEPADPGVPFVGDAAGTQPGAPAGRALPTRLALLPAAGARRSAALPERAGPQVRQQALRRELARQVWRQPGRVRAFRLLSAAVFRLSGPRTRWLVLRVQPVYWRLQQRRRLQPLRREPALLRLPPSQPLPLPPAADDRLRRPPLGGVLLRLSARRHALPARDPTGYAGGPAVLLARGQGQPSAVRMVRGLDEAAQPSAPRQRAQPPAPRPLRIRSARVCASFQPRPILIGHG